MDDSRVFAWRNVGSTASSSAGQALRFVIAWMWSIGWSGSYMEWMREARRPCPSGWRTRMSASCRREQMSVSSRAMTTARPASRSILPPCARAARAIARASAASSRVKCMQATRYARCCSLLVDTMDCSWSYDCCSQPGERSSPRTATSLAWASGSAGRVRASICRRVTKPSPLATCFSRVPKRSTRASWSSESRRPTPGPSISIAAVTVRRSACSSTAISSGPNGAASQVMRPMPGGGPTSTSRPSMWVPASMAPER